MKFKGHCFDSTGVNGNVVNLMIVALLNLIMFCYFLGTFSSTWTLNLLEALLLCSYFDIESPEIHENN